MIWWRGRLSRCRRRGLFGDTDETFASRQSVVDSLLGLDGSLLDGDGIVVSLLVGDGTALKHGLLDLAASQII